MKIKRLLGVLLSVVLLFSALPAAGVAETSISVGNSFTYTPADHWGINNDIWSWQWALSDTEDFSDMTFTTVDGQGDCYVADWDLYPYCAARKDGINIHPNADADAARVFTAPASGWVTIFVSIARANAHVISSKKSPTSFRILLEDTTIYPTEGAYRILTSTTAESITCQAFLKEGEKLRFVVGAMDNHSSDAVNLQTTVRYDSVVSTPAEICRVGESFTHVKTSATWGEADPHWSWEWTPAGNVTFSPMTYQYIATSNRYMYASDWSTNPYNYVDQLGVKLHPAEAADTVKTFTVPYTGTVKLDTDVSRYVNLSDVTASAANGTSLRILVNDTQVYPLYSNVLVLDSTTPKNFSVSLPVTAGDKIRIVIGSMGQTTSDAVRMYNTITYTSVERPAICVDDGETFSVNSTQWENNTMCNWSFEWRDSNDTFGDMTYQYVDKYGKYLYTSDWANHEYHYADLLGEKIHPAKNRDTVKTYTAPYDGRLEMKVRVARYNEYVEEGSKTPTSLCIYKNNEQIWPTNGGQKQITSTSEVTYRISADVQAGDKIRCVVGSMGNTANDGIKMYNTVTYRAVGSRELAAVTDQYNQRIDVINVWGDNLDSAETAWSWKPTTALGFTSLSTFNSPTDAKIRYSQSLKKYVVAVSSSRGFMGVVDYATGKSLWQVSVTDESNPHSIEYLPNGNVAVAASKGNWIRVYTASQGKTSTSYVQVTLNGAHGVLWDPNREILWGLGYDTITAYRIGGTAAKPTLTELTSYRTALPDVSGGGHDLSAVYGNTDRLWISSDSVFQYDIPTKTFLLTYGHAEAVARRGVKGVSSFPDSDTMVHVYPNNTYLTHDSDRFFVALLQDGKFYGVTHTHSSGAYYKVRSWISSYTTHARTEYNADANHSYDSGKVTTAATCTTAGVKTYTCSFCKGTKTESVAATGHSYEAVVSNPTCTADGYTTYTCSACGDSYVADYVDANGHTEVTVPGKDATCTETGLTDGTQCSVCGEVITAQTEIPVIGHSYENGVCTGCGAADPDVPSVVVPSVVMDYPTLSFEGEVMYNLYYTVDDMTSVVEMGLITFAERLYDGTIDDAVNVYPGYSGADGSYMSQTAGIPAKQLGDIVFVKVYAKLSDGSYVYSDVVGYHAMAYAKSILKNSTNEYMKRLVVAMINYGAEAQKFFQYNTDSLMNSFLTEEQQAMIQAYDSSKVAPLVSVDPSKVGMFTYTAGDFTKRYNSVSFDGAFSINYYFTAKGAPDNGMKLYYWSLADYNAADVLTPENATGTMDMVEGENYQFWGQVPNIAAKQVDETVFVAGVYELDGVTYTTGILAYSLGKYCQKLAADDTSNQQALSAATAVYGYYAKEYFSNKAR